MNQNLLIPKNFKFGGKTQAQLYNEAISKKHTPPIQPKPIPPTHFNKAIPLIGSDGTTKEFTAMEALAEAKKQSKLLASLKDADTYVMKNGGYYWTGTLIAYAEPGEKLGAEINYTDGNKVSYSLLIPSKFQNLTGETALILPYGNDPQNPNYEFIQGAINFWTVKINAPNLIVPTLIKRSNDWYETDANMFPNGKSSDGTGVNDRYFWQVGNGSYLGLLGRIEDGGLQCVDAYWWPSLRHGVLVYE